MRLRLARKMLLVDAFNNRRRTTWLRYVRRWTKYCNKQWRWREARGLNKRRTMSLVDAGSILRAAYPMPKGGAFSVDWAAWGGMPTK